ncbi:MULTISPECIES: sigma factor-like helix-turn-helix DNA-binding protein [Novosphingobium]|uniref:LuxR C-terminal-related transcriptional regulator n=1 Tax=Novosphingobium mangrovi (ex Hu et al. 2023) TaxID=2930094 RepID=A0ABT0AG07_9SPHN|nr:MULTISPECIES: sigma factor-like helix-turn-helix DNA-binding protein [Novosphingobium]MCJ1962105.1 LuxR C-terminal-related transcriptional regulator [Novosphingobium mangrovi (ex Hu et al. 2023)]
MPVEMDEHRARALLDGLTAKQREVLDLLVLHRTTKEIARELGIAPNTVDQRIAGVRDKWGTSNRKETARFYARLCDLCGKTTCDFSRVDEPGADVESLLQDLPDTPQFVLSDARPMMGFPEWLEEEREPVVTAPVGLETLDQKFGRIGRVAAILVLAMVMAMTLATSLAVADALERLI